MSKKHQMRNIEKRSKAYRYIGIIAAAVGMHGQANDNKKLSDCCSVIGCAASALSFGNHLNYLSKTDDDDKSIFTAVISQTIISPLVDIGFFIISYELSSKRNR